MNHGTTFTAELDQIEDLYEVSDEAVRLRRETRRCPQ
jgi:hypothetical protein